MRDALFAVGRQAAPGDNPIHSPWAMADPRKERQRGSCRCRWRQHSVPPHAPRRKIRPAFALTAGD